MIGWLSANIGTICVLLIVIAICGFIIRGMLKDKKQGKTSCGCNCAHCANAGMCHSKPTPDKK